MIFEMFELHNPFYWDFTCPEFPAGVLYGLKLSRETGTYSTKVYLAQLAQRSSSWVISVPIFCLFPQSPLRTYWYPTSWLFALFFSHLKHIARSVCDVEMGSRTQFWGYPGNQTWQRGKKCRDGIWYERMPTPLQRLSYTSFQITGAKIQVLCDTTKSRAPVQLENIDHFWLVVSTYPSEKWWSESQLGWWKIPMEIPIIYIRKVIIHSMVPVTTNQISVRLPWNAKIES